MRIPRTTTRTTMGSNPLVIGARKRLWGALEMGVKRRPFGGTMDCLPGYHQRGEWRRALLNPRLLLVAGETRFRIDCYTMSTATKQVLPWNAEHFSRAPGWQADC